MINKMKIFSSLLIIALLVGMGVMSFPQETKAAPVVAVSAGTNNPAAATVYTTYEDIPVLQIKAVNTDSGSWVTEIKLTPQYAGSATGSDYAVRIFYDADGDGIPSSGDTEVLAYTVITAADDVEQTLDITDTEISASATVNFLVLAKNNAALNAAEIVSFDIKAGGLTVPGTTTTGTITGNAMTVSATAPDITITNGDEKPVAKDVKNSAQEVAITQWYIKSGNSTVDSIKTIDLTPAENLAEATDITEVEFYLDDGSVLGAWDATDTKLVISPTDFADDSNTKTTFTITGSLFITPGAGGPTTERTILVVYDLASSAADDATHTQDIAAGADVVMGSGVALADGDITTTLSNAITIDTTKPTLSTAKYQDVGDDGTIDQIELVFDENIFYTTYEDADWVISVNGLTSLDVSAGTVSNNTTLNLTASAQANLTGVSGGTEPTLQYVVQGTFHVQDEAGNTLAAIASATVTDDAQPRAYVFEYKDNSGNGQIDRVELTFSEQVTYTYVDGNWSVTANTLAGADVSACPSCTSVTIMILTATANADLTGVSGVTEPTIAYTAGNTIVDATGNSSENISATSLVDKAAPIVSARVTLDNDNDGTVDFIKVTFTESITDSTVAVAGVQAAVSAEADGSLTESFTSGTPSSGNETDSADDASIFIGVASSSETIAAKKTDYLLKIKFADSVDDAGSNSSAAESSYTASTDGAKPIISTLTIEDTTNDGKIDKITVTWSENIDTDNSAIPVSGDFGTILLPDGSTATLGGSFTDPASSSPTIVITGITNQSAEDTGVGSTAISGDLSSNWVDGNSNTPDATGGTGNESITDSAKPIVTGVVVDITAANTGKNTVAITYSENIDVTGVADNANGASTTAVGDMTAAVTLAGFGSFASGDVTYTTLKNNVAVNSGGTVVTITMANASDGYKTAGSTSPSGNFTPVADAGDVQDAAGNAVNTAVVSATVTNAWDLTAPTITSITVTDVDKDGKIDKATIIYGNEIDEAKVTVADWTLGSKAGESTDATTGANTTFTIVRTADDLTVGTAASDADTLYTVGDLGDTFGNKVAAINAGAVTETDDAEPVPKDAQMQDTDNDGKIDQLTIIFTENISTITNGANSQDDVTVASASDFAGTIVISSVAAAGSSPNYVVGFTGITTVKTSLGDLILTFAGTISEAITDGTNSAVTTLQTKTINTSGGDFAIMTDAAGPIVVTRVTQETGTANGKLDGVLVTFSENMDASETSSGNFTITTAADGALTETYTDTTDDTTLLLGVSDAPADDTANLLKVTLTAANFKDLTGNTLTAGSSQTSATDGAGPVIITVQTMDNNTATGETHTVLGQIDAIKLTFSESVSDSTVTGSNWTSSVTGFAGDTWTTGATANDQFAIVTITESGSSDTDATPNFAVSSVALADSTGNTVVDYTSAAATDNAAPVIVTTTPASSAAGVQLNTDVVVVFSEPITTGSLTFTFSPALSSSSTVWTDSDKTLTISHSNFSNGLLMTVDVTAAPDASAGTIALIAGPVPNSWTFTTISGGVILVAGGGTVADTTPPTSTSISIAGGATETTSEAVTLTLAATGATNMLIANNSTFAGGSWETYATSKSWTLTAGLGEKTVYVQFKDGSNNVSSSVSDTITLVAQAVVEVTTTGEVTASAGGTTSLSTEEGTTVEIVVPANAVSANTTIEIQSVSTSTAVSLAGAVPTGKSMASAYNLSATSDGVAVTAFSQALTVTLTYTDSQIAGLDESTLKIYRWTGSAWQALPTSVNAETNTLTTTTTNFSYFAIMGTVPVEEEVTAPTTTTPISEMTLEELQAFIDDILAQIAVLQAQLAELTGDETLGVVPALCQSITFTRSLTDGTVGSDVKCLQALLNQSVDTEVASSGVGSVGNETNYFGSLTAVAVGKLQMKYNVVADSSDPGYGYVGPKTRAQLNSLLGQ